MSEVVTVNERPAGKIPTTGVTNELARAVRALSPVLQHGQHIQPTHGPAFEIWLVWDAGPNGEANKTNHQYWLRRAYLSNPKGDPYTDPPDLKERPMPEVVPDFPDDWILATNLAERPANVGGTEADGTHGLAKGQAVGPVWIESVALEPAVTRYVFNNGSSAVLPLPQYIYMVYQGVAANQAGFDYVRAAPTI